jgi:nucleotidyltransferase/DNA polymerase involved in DNA repair
VGGRQKVARWLPANYLARQHNVKSGLPLFMAKKRLEGTDAAFLPWIMIIISW